jgi:hypothetical protein
VEVDELGDPADVTFLGLERVMAQPHEVADLIEKARRPRECGDWDRRRHGRFELRCLRVRRWRQQVLAERTAQFFAVEEQQGEPRRRCRIRPGGGQLLEERSDVNLAQLARMLVAVEEDVEDVLEGPVDLLVDGGRTDVVGQQAQSNTVQQLGWLRRRWGSAGGHGQGLQAGGVAAPCARMSSSWSRKTPRFSLTGGVSAPNRKWR